MSASSARSRSPEPIIIVVRRRLNRWAIARRRRPPAARGWRRYAVAGVEHRTASIREPWRVLAQAGHDTIDIRDLIAAEPPDVRRAGHLLLHRPAIVVGACSRWNHDAASQRDEKHYEEEDNRFSHAGRFIKLNGCGSCPRAGSCAMNEACESSRAQENVKTVPGFVSSLVPLSASSPLRSAWSKTPPAPRRARAAGRRAASPNGPRLRAASSL